MLSHVSLSDCPCHALALVGVPPQVVAMLVADNLDLCCQVIEKAAGERAQREIDERLAGAYSARARTKAAGQPFVDASLMQGRFPGERLRGGLVGVCLARWLSPTPGLKAGVVDGVYGVCGSVLMLPAPALPAGALPEALRPRPGQLSPQQQRVYEDFARIPRTAAAAQQSTGQPRPAGALPPEGGAGEPGTVPPPGPPPPGVAPSTPEAEQAAAAAAGAAGMAPPPPPDLRSRFISWLQRMDLAVAKDPQTPLGSLADGSGRLWVVCVSRWESFLLDLLSWPAVLALLTVVLVARGQQESSSACFHLPGC
jgi:CCR4-NOT transcription complex subunit 1